MSPLRIEDDDLRDFVQHLSYRHRGEPNEMRLYDFPGEPHQAAPAIHLQIALRWAQNRLELFRAQRPNLFFYESDE